MKRKIIYYVVVFLLGALGMYFIMKKPIDVDLDPYLQRIEQAENTIDSLERINDSLKVEADSIYNIITLHDKEIKELTEELKDTKQKYEEALDNVQSYTNDELEQFFTNRYKRYY